LALSYRDDAGAAIDLAINNIACGFSHAMRFWSTSHLRRNSPAPGLAYDGEKWAICENCSCRQPVESADNPKPQDGRR
jgi:hypothetical protein